MKVLLVDDDLDIQFVARLALKRAGFTVSVAASGAEALESVQRDRPDVILLDWMMPDMDGPEACRRLKQSPDTSGIPVIFVTARSQQAEIGRGIALGAAGYIVKPFDALSLGDEIRKLLGLA